MSDLGRLYQESILMHHRAPRHAGRLDRPTHAADGKNPLCGDGVRVTLDIGVDRLIDVRCDVQGCAICRASGSMMAEAIIGRDLGEVKTLLDRFLAELCAAPGQGHGGELPESAGDPQTDPARWGPLAALLEARRFPNRRRCASLPWEVLQRAFQVQQAPGPSRSRLQTDQASGSGPQADQAPGSRLQAPSSSQRDATGPREGSTSPEPESDVPGRSLKPEV